MIRFKKYGLTRDLQTAIQFIGLRAASIVRVLGLGAILFCAVACQEPQLVPQIEKQVPQTDGEVASRSMSSEGKITIVKGYWFDGDGARDLTVGLSSQVDAVKALKGPPYRKVVFDDKSYSLCWYYISPWDEAEQGYRAWWLRIKFNPNGVMRSNFSECKNGLNFVLPWFSSRKGDVLEWSYLDSQGLPIEIYTGN